MTAPSHAVVVELQVPFHDVDALGIVWHGHYLKYAEIGRSALLRAHDLDMPQVVALGVGMLVVDLAVRYSSPLRYADRLHVATWCTRLDHRIDLAFEIRNVTANRQAARGKLSLVVTDLTGRMLIEAPYEITRRLLATA